MQPPPQSPLDPPRLLSSPSVWRFTLSTSLRALQLLRTVHLYCSLRPYQPASSYTCLVQSIDSRIARIMPHSPSPSVTLSNCTAKIAALLRIAQWAVKGEVTSSELLSLYRQWRISNEMGNVLEVWSDPDADEIDTYFVLKDLQFCSEDQLESLVRELEALHCLFLQASPLGVDHDQVPIPVVHQSWFDKVHAIFRYLDQDNTGQLDAENTLWLMLALMLPESANDVDEETLRKHVCKQLDQMRACKGYASLYQFQVYLLYQGLHDEESLEVLLARLEFISGHWQAVRSEIVPAGRELGDRHFPALWTEAVFTAVPEGFLRKYMCAFGLEIAYTPTIYTKGKTYAYGAFIPYPIPFAQGLYTSYLSLLGEGFPHLSSDPRYHAILSAVTKYAALTKATVAKVIGKCREA